MIKEGTTIPIQSPSASPEVLCSENNGLPPDNPEAYRFVVDYRKFNAITRHPRYLLQLIEDFITNFLILRSGVRYTCDTGTFSWQ
ncbi:hypothetical protein TNCV_4374861 [Trichonephila clavipes]|uniref:Uncharacterized protein n=1 Tax=Trichonephila clavipes TaxID=2585209 RepID=A0A8X6W2B1_TRICX|nr:hypothetical protein TNCV_4374861 [Trichonephila clavipes]